MILWLNTVERRLLQLLQMVLTKNLSTFRPKLREHMKYCIEHREEISKLAKVKAQVSEVKGVMIENIEKVLDRGEKIELLVDKTENLHNQGQDFRNTDEEKNVAAKHED